MTLFSVPGRWLFLPGTLEDFRTSTLWSPETLARIGTGIPEATVLGESQAIPVEKGGDKGERSIQPGPNAQVLDTVMTSVEAQALEPDCPTVHYLSQHLGGESH